MLVMVLMVEVMPVMLVMEQPQQVNQKAHLKPISL